MQIWLSRKFKLDSELQCSSTIWKVKLGGKSRERRECEERECEERKRERKIKTEREKEREIENKRECVFAYMCIHLCECTFVSVSWTTERHMRKPPRFHCVCFFSSSFFSVFFSSFLFCFISFKKRFFCFIFFCLFYCLFIYLFIYLFGLLFPIF
jgi:hypothetical protein